MEFCAYSPSPPGCPLIRTLSRNANWLFKCTFVAQRTPRNHQRISFGMLYLLSLLLPAWIYRGLLKTQCKRVQVELSFVLSAWYPSIHSSGVPYFCFWNSNLDYQFISPGRLPVPTWSFWTHTKAISWWCGSWALYLIVAELRSTLFPPATLKILRHRTVRNWFTCWATYRLTSVVNILSDVCPLSVQDYPKGRQPQHPLPSACGSFPVVPRGHCLSWNQIMAYCNF